MLLLRRSSFYARHIGARSIRNARQGNVYLLLAFVSCLVVFLRSLFGAGYNEPLLAVPPLSIVPLVPVKPYLHLSIRPTHPYISIPSKPLPTPSPDQHSSPPSQLSSSPGRFLPSLLQFLRLDSKQSWGRIIREVWEQIVETEHGIQEIVVKRKDRLLGIYRHHKTDEDEEEDEDGKGMVDREGAPAITTLNLKASLGAKWYEFKSRVEEMRKAREEGHDDAVQVEKVE